MKRNLILLIAIIFTSLHGMSKNINDNFCQIVSVKYQESINIPRASEHEGERLIVWNKGDVRFNQIWKFEPVKNDYIIRSKYNNKVISVENKTVTQKEYNQSEEQLWKIKNTEGGIFIISNGTGLALSVEPLDSNNKELVLTDFDKRESQKWVLQPAGLENYKADFNKVLSPEEMRQDVEYFFSKLEEVHVNPCAFVGCDSLEKRKESLLESLSQPMKRYEFTRVLSALNGMFDGHTGIMSDFDWDYMNYFKYSYGRYIPCYFKYQPGKLTFDTGVDSLKNLKIMSINHISTNKISNEIEKRENLEIKAMRNYEISNNYHGLLFGLFDIQSPYQIEVLDTLNHVKRMIEFDGIPYFQMPKKNKSVWKDYDMRIYPEDSIAIIEHNTCMFLDYSPEMNKFYDYIDSVFRVINQAGIKHLFIDISRNGGGGSNANNVFYRNINHDPHPWQLEFKRKVSQESKFLLTGFSLAEDSDPYDERLAKYNAKVEAGLLSEFQTDFVNAKNGELYGSTIKKNTDRVTNGYSNKIYLIQGFLTFSAPIDMAGWFKYGKVGPVIGSETGGTTEVYIEGIPFFMPRSNIKFRVADEYEKYPDGELHKGIQPDINLGPGFYKDHYDLNDLKQFIRLANQKN